MKILVTGAAGFVGKNVTSSLHNHGYEVFAYNKDDSLEELDNYLKESDFIIHLAGVNRPENVEDYYRGNSDFTDYLCKQLLTFNRKTPILLSSSIQASLDNPYGKSKLLAEQTIIDYSISSGAEVFIYRFHNLFGKWSTPNYNSVIATWCYNISRNIPISINNPDTEITLEYIDDVVTEMISTLKGSPNRIDTYYCSVSKNYETKLGSIAQTLQSFKEGRSSLVIPNLGDELIKKLYSTYLSYLDPKDFSYSLVSHIDERGSFTEFLKSSDRGQVSINVSKPGITKGNHWHHTKHEKFLVVRGEGVIKLREIDSDTVYSYKVSGDELNVIDIPAGYTHSIVNESNEDLITIIWVNEIFDQNNPDTYTMEV
ncbi:SDR family oxidoreductase [Erysipelothrix sp. HDW6A]|uniref:polysaccharide biosynthesis C-terminal domain-containing protein n=1 Tax=Erysipelothrix sp. HDW6A TaxID=2714928 RepID=UPI00140A0FD7|nr:NAD-dependent epimerase/dehydratase family protein [Erysipelothrix sp. HDW6A]QIK57524.1 SDR family oxidoreductase [Erysipelothrix sp. HDW6A]